MPPSLRRCALCFALLSLPALAGTAREDRHAARLRAQSARPEGGEVQPSEALPIAAAAADAGGVDLAGFLGILTALAATYVYARGQRVPAGRVVAPSTPGSPPDCR